MSRQSRRIEAISLSASSELQPPSVPSGFPRVALAAATPLQSRARSFARHVITPLSPPRLKCIRRLSVTEIMARYEPTLTRNLDFKLKNARRQAVREDIPLTAAGARRSAD